MRDVVRLVIIAALGYLFGYFILGPLAHAEATPSRKIGLVKIVHGQKHKTYRIAILDQGYNPKLGIGLKLCLTGHFDYWSKKPIVGVHGNHGNFIASIIAEELAGVDYCAIIFQLEDPAPGERWLPNITDALRRLQSEDVTAVNMSYNGRQHQFSEANGMRALALKGTAMFVAAGNNNENLDYVCSSYPACYYMPNIYVCGALDHITALRAPYSNYGQKVTQWYLGFAALNGEEAYGTSFAVPRALSDYVRSLAAKDAASSQ